MNVVYTCVGKLKIQCPLGRTGSSPVFSTDERKPDRKIRLFCFQERWKGGFRKCLKTKKGTRRVVAFSFKMLIGDSPTV